jgi:CubicO group peptidase (beta-lactamase class C family)
MATIDALAALRSLTPFLDDWLAFQRWYRQVPGLSVGIAVGDEIVFTAGYGVADVEHQVPASPTTRFRIASHSKVFTATAIMQLVEQGRVRLDDRVADHVDWFRPGGPDDELAHVTVRHLLSHSSGLTRDGASAHWHDDRFPSRDELVAQVGTMAVFGTAEHLKYSNIGFTLAGQIIEAVTGRRYEDYVAEVLLEPLGLAATTPDLPQDLDGHAVGYPRWLPDHERPPFDHVRAGIMNSATGFSSNAVDLLRWYRAHRFGNGELLHDRSKREMQRVHFEEHDNSWGLGFSIVSVGGMQFASHGGGYPGFISYSGVEREHGLAVVVLTNAGDGPARSLFDAIAKLAERALNGEFDGSPPFDRHIADDLAGFYEHRWGISQVARVGSKLVAVDPIPQDPTLNFAVLDHVDQWTFRYPSVDPFGSSGEVVRFEPGTSPSMHGPAMLPIGRKSIADLAAPDGTGRGAS